MGAWLSKTFGSRSSPPLSEPRSLPIASVLAQETRDGAGVLARIPPSEAAGPSRKRLHSALPEDGRDANVGNGVVPDSALLNDDDRFQLASARPESLLFSCQPLGAASDMVLGPSRSMHGVQPMSSFKLDAVKHKIFLSHAGAQKGFTDQLCRDLEHKGYFFPFFDQRHHSLPKGEDFGPLIIEAAQLCHVAVIVLSEEYLCSKWPMIELAEFYAAQQGARDGVVKLKLLPLFFKLSIEEVKDEDRWMPKWKEHAACDDRIDLSQWSAAVKALCKSNGLDFGTVGRKEVAYRECVVKSIFKLSPPDLLFGTCEKMVGCGRMCEAMATQFVEDTTIGARVLGVYGVAGLGKTMLAKALHDYFYEEFLGKVCYIDMCDGLIVQHQHKMRKVRARRQKKMLKMLCGFEKDEMDHIGDDEGKELRQMKMYVKREPIFLVLDNITNDGKLLQEVRDYLNVGFHFESRILITSSSKAILEDLLPNIKFYVPMPTLMVEEAGALFLKHAVPMKALPELTRQEQDIFQICIQKCLLDSEEGRFYHPVALMALADYFFGCGGARKSQLLDWKDCLEKDSNFVKEILKDSKDLNDILGLQFSTFDFSEKLLFLDLALYFEEFFEEKDDLFDFICRLHGESATIITKKMWDLRRSGMIEFEPSNNIRDAYIRAPFVYQEFAKWYATKHKEPRLENAWGVFEPRGDSSTRMKSLSNLIRLRIFFDTTPPNAQCIANKRMREFSNLVVLQLFNCDNLKMLNLEGLRCLRVLELNDLPKLKTITLCGNSSKDEDVDIYSSLLHVEFRYLESLVAMPNLTRCTSLHSVIVDDTEVLGCLEGAICYCLKALILSPVTRDHFQSLLRFGQLRSLEYLSIHVKLDVDLDVDLDVYSDVDSDVDSDVHGFNGIWERKKGKEHVHLEAFLEGEGLEVEFLKTLCPLLYRSNSMICTHFGTY